ncbi:MAG: hypothetical protein EBT07_16400, partial [Actinobacteria bacterium]|nr:hypothetical protein [Actinomycetota bacterium]
MNTLNLLTILYNLREVLMQNLLLHYYVSFREIQIRNEMQMPEVLRAMREHNFDVQFLQNEQNPLANL